MNVTSRILCLSANVGTGEDRLLRARRERPDLFVGASYRPLAVTGVRQDDVVAYLRETQHAALLVVAPLRCAAMVSAELTLSAAWWQDTRIELPTFGAEWRPIVGGAVSGNMLAPSGPGSDFAYRVAIAQR